MGTLIYLDITFCKAESWESYATIFFFGLGLVRFYEDQGMPVMLIIIKGASHVLE
jgi:hypothetical protein